MPFSKILIGLTSALLLSAMAVIISKYHSRSLFIAIQKQEKKLDRDEISWGQLQLEINTLTEENRLESIATTQLKLIIPQHKDIIYLKP